MSHDLSADVARLTPLGRELDEALDRCVGLQGEVVEARDDAERLANDVRYLSNRCEQLAGTLRAIARYLDEEERPDAVWIEDRIKEALRP